MRRDAEVDREDLFEFRALPVIVVDLQLRARANARLTRRRAARERSPRYPAWCRIECYVNHNCYCRSSPQGWLDLRLIRQRGTTDRSSAVLHLGDRGQFPAGRYIASGWHQDGPTD